MCIICSDSELGEEYLKEIFHARQHLKKAEAALLQLGKNLPEKNYDKAHKMLVKIRKSIDKVEQVREKDHDHNKLH